MDHGHAPMHEGESNKVTRTNSPITPAMTLDGAMAGAMLSHPMDPKDYDNPMNWPLHRRVYTTACSWFYAFTM